MNGRRILRGIVVTILLLTGVAHAEPTVKDRAAESFRQARAAFARRDFTAAALAFEQAGEYHPHPVAWLDAAEAWVAANEFVRAAQDCDRVLDDPATAPQFRKEAETRMKTVSKRVGTLSIEGDATALVSLDGSAAFAVPAKRRALAGSHVVTATDVGSAAPRRFTVTVRAGEVLDVDTRASPPPSPAPAPTPPPAFDPPPEPPVNGDDAPIPRRSNGPPAATWVAFGVAGVAGAATVVFGLRTSTARDDYTTHPTVAARDAFYQQRLLTNVSLGVVAAALLTGGIVWLVSSRSAAQVTAARGGIRF